MRITIYNPPDRTNKTSERTLKIFLAGSIEMGIAEDWQLKLIDHLRNLRYRFPLEIYNPRRDDWDSNWDTDFTSPQFNQQVNWELDNLERADLIIMNFLPDTKSPISLLELGLFAKSGKMLVVCPKEFWKSGNVHTVCNRLNIPLYESMEELLRDITITDDLKPGFKLGI